MTTFLQQYWKTLVIVVLVFLLSVLGLTYYFAERSRYVYSYDAQVNAYGVNLSPDILGRVVSMHVDEGSTVKKGDLIVDLLDDILIATEKQNTADIEKNNQKVRLKEAELEKIKNNFVRAKRGIDDKIISEETFDHADKNYAMAKADYRYALASLKKSKAELNVTRAKLTHTQVVSPINGVVAKRWIMTGDVMNPGQTMFTIYDTEHPWVVARLDERKIAKVKVGDRVHIFVDAYPGKIFEGRVGVLKPAAASEFSLIPQNNATGNYTKVAQRIPVKIFFNGTLPEDCYVFPGMNVEVKIFVDGR